MPVAVSDKQAEEWLTAIVRWNFTKAEQAEWEDIRKAVRAEGQYEETDFGVFRQIKEWTAKVMEMPR